MVLLFLNMLGLVVLMTLSSDLHFKTANCKFSRIFRSYFLNKKIYCVHKDMDEQYNLNLQQLKPMTDE